MSATLLIPATKSNSLLQIVVIAEEKNCTWLKKYFWKRVILVTTEIFIVE